MMIEHCSCYTSSSSSSSKPAYTDTLCFPVRVTALLPLAPALPPDTLALLGFAKAVFFLPRCCCWAPVCVRGRTPCGICSRHVLSAELLEVLHPAWLQTCLSQNRCPGSARCAQLRPPDASPRAQRRASASLSGNASGKSYTAGSGNASGKSYTPSGGTAPPPFVGDDTYTAYSIVSGFAFAFIVPLISSYTNEGSDDFDCAAI